MERLLHATVIQESTEAGTQEFIEGRTFHIPFDSISTLGVDEHHSGLSVFRVETDSGTEYLCTNISSREKPKVTRQDALQWLKSQYADRLVGVYHPSRKTSPSGANASERTRRG